MANSGPDELRAVREHCEGKRKEMDLATLRSLHFLPKSAEMYQTQYFYPSQDSQGNVLPLTGEMIEYTILTPAYGQAAHVDKKYIKKMVILGDVLFLPEFLAPFLVTCKAGTFLNIFPHTYVVPSNDPIVRQTSVGFIEIINKSKSAFTFGELLSDHELFFDLMMLQPDCISINIGVADIKQENVSWQFSQIPNEFVKRIQDMIGQLQTYFFNAGSKGAFAENLTYTLNLLPMYAALDAKIHNVQNVYQAVCHTNNWGTTYYNVSREEYKVLADEINKKLHRGSEGFFDKYQLVLLNPTPRWEFENLHVDRRSGLPSSEMHNAMLSNFFYALSRVACTRRICTLGIHSSRTSRKTDKQLGEGCTIMYKKTIEEEK